MQDSRGLTVPDIDLITLNRLGTVSTDRDIEVRPEGAERARALGIAQGTIGTQEDGLAEQSLILARGTCGHYGERSVIAYERAALEADCLVMAIVGGALMPPLQGLIIDQGTILGFPAVNISFCLPLFCFIVIAIYGYCAFRSRGLIRD